MANGKRYGMVLAKDKSEDEAMKWLIRSVHLYPMNWGCWQEMTSLINQVEDVRTPQTQRRCCIKLLGMVLK